MSNKLNWNKKQIDDVRMSDVHFSGMLKNQPRIYPISGYDSDYYN